MSGNYSSLLAQVNLRSCELLFVSCPEFSSLQTIYMRESVLLRLFCDFINSSSVFANKKLLHHVSPENLDGTRLQDVGLLCGQGCHIIFSRNSSKIVALSFCVIACHCEASGRDTCFLICMHMFPRYYLASWIDLPAKRTQQSGVIPLSLQLQLPLEPQVAQGRRPFVIGLSFDALIVV